MLHAWQRGLRSGPVSLKRNRVMTRSFLFATILAALPALGHAQSVSGMVQPMQVWPKHEAWQTTLTKVGEGGAQCLMVNEQADEKQDFGFGLIVQRLPELQTAFSLFDIDPAPLRTDQLGVMVDQKDLGTIGVTKKLRIGIVFNDVVMIDPDDMKALIGEMRQGTALEISAQDEKYTFSLTGFNAALDDVISCTRKLDQFVNQAGAGFTDVP
jgi:hypothetical protein